MLALVEIRTIALIVTLCRVALQKVVLWGWLLGEEDHPSLNRRNSEGRHAHPRLAAPRSRRYGAGFVCRILRYESCSRAISSQPVRVRYSLRHTGETASQNRLEAFCSSPLSFMLRSAMRLPQGLRCVPHCQNDAETYDRTEQTEHKAIIYGLGIHFLPLFPLSAPIRCIDRAK